jgi:hypothetical protein
VGRPRDYTSLKVEKHLEGGTASKLGQVRTKSEICVLSEKSCDGGHFRSRFVVEDGRKKGQSKRGSQARVRAKPV